MAKRWYVVHAKTGCEPIAALNLRRQNYEVWLPLSYRTVRHARQIRTVRVAFFPGYLFVSLDLEIDRWRAVDGTSGVIGMLKANERPAPAPPGFVEALRALSDGDGALDLSRGIEPGAAVRLIAGPFADQLGVVENLRGSDRVRVLLSIMNQTVPLELERTAVALV